MFTRGYKPLTDKLSTRSKFYIHCNNCYFYYAEDGEKEEFCQNNNVTQFDMYMNGTTIYCSMWQPPIKDKEKKAEKNDYLSRFKKSLKKG